MESTSNQLQITGKVMEIGETITGESNNGQWKRAHMVLWTLDKYPKDVFFSVWGDTINQLERVKDQDIVNVKFNVVSRKHDGKWYTECQAWRIDVNFHAMREAQNGNS